jgi:hypothetical protein
MRNESGMSGVVIGAMLDRCFVKAAELSCQEHPRVDDESVAKVVHVRSTTSPSRPYASREADQCSTDSAARFD